MSEVEKQESQKTVVAFVTGLLIGGLLVWVFSSTPAEKAEEMNQEKNDTKEEVAKKDVAKDVDIKIEDAKGEEKKKIEITGEGKISLGEQKAGMMVMLGEIKPPTNDGWVVVRESRGDNTWSVMGASRYIADTGVIPSEIELVRTTEAGKEYQVVFYANGGDANFSQKDDTMIEGTVATFKAN